MKIRYMSDTHNEGNGNFSLKNNGEDALVLAGDITTAYLLDKDPNAVKFFEQVASEFDVVFYVLGNHELYRWKDPNSKSWVDLIRNKLWHISNLFILDNDVVTYKGWRIAGATLWTDFGGATLKLRQESLMNIAPHYMRDYAWGLKPYKVLEWHYESVEFLKNSKADLVITHHAPTSHTVSPLYEGNSYNAYFHSNLDEVLATLNPKVWIHGHMHHKAKTKVGNTIIALNPKGYKNENPYFNELESLEWN